MYGYTMSKPREEKNVSIPDDILKELLTPSEIRMLKNRYRIIKLLQDGMSIRSIASQVEVGTDTVMRVSRMLEKKKLQELTGQQRIKTSTPWIFGKSDN